MEQHEAKFQFDFLNDDYGVYDAIEKGYSNMIHFMINNCDIQDAKYKKLILNMLRARSK